jgi:hypothetical protein
MDESRRAKTKRAEVGGAIRLRRRRFAVLQAWVWSAAFIISRFGRRCTIWMLVLPASRSASLRYFGKDGRGIMSRVGLTAAVAAVVGISLTGCTSALSSSTSSQQVQALNFDSDPPGAVIRTTQGQTCVTPCELTVPSYEQPVTITKDDYVPQTVQVTLGPQPDHSFWQNPPPTLVPNPVRVVLQPVPKPVHHARSHKSASRKHTAKTATATATAPNAAASAFPSFPSPPPMQQPASK